MNVERLLLAAGMIFTQGFATPVILLNKWPEFEEQGQIC
jgi:hypothetical protein